MKQKLLKNTLLYLLILILTLTNFQPFSYMIETNVTEASSNDKRLYYYDKYEGYFWDTQQTETYTGESRYLFKNSYESDGGWHTGGLAKIVGGKYYAIMYSDYEIVPVKYGRFTSYEFRLTGEQVLVPKGRFSGSYFVSTGKMSGTSIYRRGEVDEFYYGSRGFSFRTGHNSTRLELVRGRRIYKNSGKGEFIDTIEALDGQYPDDGYYSGYYYVKKEPVIYKPTISLEEPINNIYIGLDEEIIISGTVIDKNPNEMLTLYYTIDGVPAHTNKRLGTSIISNSETQHFTRKIVVDNTIPEGEINLRIWVEDDSEVLGAGYSNQKSTVQNRNINIVKTLSLINKLIERNIKSEDKPQIIIANTNAEIQNIYYNEVILQELRQNLNNVGNNLYFIGQNGVTEDYITENLTENYSYTKDVNNIISFIKSIDNEIKINNIFTVGDHINHIFNFEDLEKDYKDISIEDKIKNKDDIPREMKVPNELFAKYEHNPNIFDNPVPKHSKDTGIWEEISSIEDPYIISKAEVSMRGEWTLTITGTDDTRSPNWDKFADEKTLSFTIHEKPNAIIEHWQEETEPEIFLTSENSYDIDYEHSKANKGIKKYVWEYQTEDGNWHEYLVTTTEKRLTLPKQAGGQAITNYSLTVYDYHNATDTILTSIAPPELMEPEAIIVAPESIYIGPHGAEALIITNNSEPKASISNYEYEFNFRSVDNYLKKSLNTTVNSESHTFNKNTLRYVDGAEIFNRDITLRVTSLEGIVYESTENLQVIPVTIDSMESTSIDVNKITLSSIVKNGNPTDHEAIVTVNGIDYTMSYVGGERWEVDVNIAGAERLYARVQKKSDSSILYDKHDIVANRPPTVTGVVNPTSYYEGDRVAINVLATDPDMDNLSLTAKQRIDGGLWSLIWTKSNVASGSTLKFYIDNVTPGNHEIILIAEDTNGASGTYTLSFNVRPISIIGELAPNPALAGDELIFNIETEGYVEKIEIVVPADMAGKDDEPGKFNRSGKYTYPLTLNVDENVEIKTNTFKYITSVLTDKTLTPENQRLREPYKFKVRAHKGDVIRETELELEVRRSVLDLIKPGINHIGGTE